LHRPVELARVTGTSIVMSALSTLCVDLAITHKPKTVVHLETQFPVVIGTEQSDSSYIYDGGL
jgi:hypothetical protein